MKISHLKIKLSFILLSLQMLTTYCIAQNNEAHREDELAIGVKIVSGNIIFGPNKFYITEPNSVYVQPGIRYDYPVNYLPTVPGGKMLLLQCRQAFCFAKQKILIHSTSIQKILLASLYRRAFIICRPSLSVQSCSSGRV